ncbi:MAG TPA: hypothetical protein VL400_25905 [Polyangiaceae bacterium]|nr:hypothetical protein [Polyangiaceae bacterium]
MRRSRVGFFLATLALGGAALAVSGLGCSPSPITASVRSLERAGKVAFVCLAGPGSDGALRPLSDCSAAVPVDDGVTLEPSDFGDGSSPHLYALVTLDTRGEVAVIDTTAEESNVLDQDPSTPGENSLPVGAQPTDIVATPKGTATFVTSADIGRPAIYALSNDLIRPCEVDDARCDLAPLTLTSWPACRLPSIPGAMTLVADPAIGGQTRETCGGVYADVAGPTPAFGDIDREGLGRQKLVVTLPKEGKVVVIDAQSLLSRDPGSFDDCDIEAEIPLSTTLPAPPPPEVIPDGPACVPPAPRQIDISASGVSTPSSMAYGGGQLYIGDLTTPVVHVLDATSPCDLAELPPLLATSLEDPDRRVSVGKVAVSPAATPSLKRWVYAVDVEDRSLMIFDVSGDGAPPVPIVRPHSELNPLSPRDRIRFASAPTDIVMMHRDDPKSTGDVVAPFGTECAPSGKTCSGDSADCDLGTLYQTSSDFEDGAGPLTLRGAFAMVALSSGQIAVIDIEDFDAPCRGPITPSPVLGCDADAVGGDKSTNEASCNVVLPHATRSGAYILTNDDVGRHEPGIQTYPILSTKDGTVVTDGPIMRATLPPGLSEAHVAVGGSVDTIAGDGSITTDDGTVRNALRMNLADPRVHNLEQDWAVVYQGALPGFFGKAGDLAVSSESRTFTDATGRFCAGGVQSREAIKETLATEGLTGADLDARAEAMADRLFISEPLADQENNYWDTASCTWEACRAAFGDVEVPTVSRDLVVSEAYEDHLELEAPQGTTDDMVECCFPTLVNYDLRAGDEWVVIGASTGYLHHMIADPETGVCRPSCDPAVQELVGRARTDFSDSTPADGELGSFVSPHFRFAILVPTTNDQENAAVTQPQRDMAFRFTTAGNFIPLRGELTNSDRPAVAPRAIGYLPVIDELYVSDGGLEGLLLVTSDLSSDIRQYF